MSVRRLVFMVLLASLCSSASFAQVAGQNINMVSGTDWPAGDPYLQRQNEPSMAVSSRNPEHILAGANDYRTVDIPNPQAPNILGDAWVGVFTTIDGGETWKSTLVPGFPQDTSPVGTASPLHQFTVATDPTVRAGTHGLFYYSGLVFNRGTGSPSGVFVATFQDQNNKGNGDSAILMKNNNGTVHGNPFSYINVNLVDTGTSGQFLDKPWIAVDIPRVGRTATCKINGQTFSSGYVYIVYTQFNGSQNNPASKIKEVTSTDCGATWSHPQILSQSQKLAQGTVAAIDPSNGNVYVAWRQIAASNGSQSDAIQWAFSTNGGSSFNYEPAVYTFPAPTTKNPYPAGAVFDQPSANSTTFRSLDVPALAVDANSRVWVAFSQRVNGPTTGTYGSRIMVTTLPKGSMTWTTPYIADGTAPLSAYGHQFMPSLNFAYGKLALAWYDSRRDNMESILACASGTCTDLSQLTHQDQPIPGSTIANPTTIFTPTLSDPNSGIRHTVDVFGGVIDPSAGPKAFTGFQISQYPYWVNPSDDQIEQGFFNAPNLPIFVQGTTPFIGDYIDIAAQSILPNGPNSWIFNTQGKDAVTGATNAPDFHVTWTDNRDVVPPPVINNTEDWTRYVPPNSGTNQSSTYFGTGTACPTCSTTQPVCSTVLDDNGAPSAYSGDRNQNVYTSRITNGLVVRFRENAKPLSTSVQRSFSLLVKNTVSPLNTNPLGSPSYYRIMLGVTSTSQTPSCSVTGGTASLASTANCYLDVAINPKTTLTQAITINSSSASASLNVLVAQIQSIPATGSPTFTGLQALAVINGDSTNPSVADPDFLTTDNSNPDVAAPYGTLPIAVGETYDPTVDGPPEPDSNNTDIFSPKIGVPAVFSPKIGTVANSTPAIQTPTVFSPKIFSPKIFSVQVVNPKVVNAIFSPKIFSPKIFSPKIVSPEIFSPKIADLADSTGGATGGSNGGTNPVTDYSWRVSNRGNTSASYSTKEFAKSAGVSCCPASCSSNPNSCQVTADNPAGSSCSLCQLVQHKVYESPTANRESTSGNPTCDLNVQQESIVVANITDPAFTTSTSGTVSAADPRNSTLTLSPGEGNRVTLRVIAPQVNQTVSSFKTRACSFTPDSGQNTSTCSLVIATSALPVAIVGQSYNTTLLSNGGTGTTFWSVTPDPTSPVAVIPPPTAPESLPVSPLTLSPAGVISSGNGVVTALPGSYTINMQVQDSASPPSLDPQQVPMLVNQFTVSNVNVAISNEVGSTAYMKTGDVATVAVTINNQGPATATSVAPTLAVNVVAAGPASGPNPAVNCTGPVGTNMILGDTTGIFTFTCAASTGNGYVTFTAHATGQYMNSPAATTVATATAVSAPTLAPSGTPPNVVVDTLAPMLTFASTTTAQSGPGWYNTPVVIPFTAIDNLSGLLSANATSPATGSFLGNGALSLPGAMTLMTEGKLVTGVVTVTDYALNAAPVTSSGFNIDRTLPTITGAPDRAANTFTWYNAPVTITFTCNDPNPTNGPMGQQSGIGSCTSPITLAGEGTNQSASGTAKDVAGNSAGTTVSGINIDTTPPTIMGTPDRPANANNWYNAPVTVSFVCADPNPLHGLAGQQSGISSCTAPVMLSQGANQSAPGAAVDKAGNSAAVVVSGINIDQTPPAIVANSTYTRGTWTNQSVTVTFTCTDDLSGPVVAGSPNPIITGIPLVGATLTYTQPNALTSVATVTLTADTPGTTLNSTCRDLAGNNAQQVAFGPIQIDTTPPTVTATASLNASNGPVYTAGTWTNQSVVVTFGCSDSLSGVKPGSITANTTFGSPGTYTANGSCQDVAGNTGNGSFGPVQIDITTPGVLITSPVSQTYLLNQQITPNFTCGDNSGGDTTTCTAIPSASPYTASAVGPATFSVHAVDQAGNVTNPDPSASYLVIYNFTGFQPPLQSAVMMNPPNPATPPQPRDSGTFTVGATIPITWQLQDANAVFISDPATLTSIVAIPNPACAGAVSGSGTTLYDGTTGQAAFSYDAVNNRFVFNWNTTGTTTGCYNVVVTTKDTAQWSTIVHVAADTFAGFDDPLTTASAPANPSNSGTFDTGSTIPVMWQLATPNGPDSAQAVNLNNVTAYANAACAGAPPSGTASTILYDRAGSQGTFSFEPSTAVYSVNWAAGATPAGCYDVVVTLSDQSVYTTMVTLAAPGGVTTLLQYNFDNVPQGSGSQTAPASFTAPSVAGGAFGYSGTNANGISSNGCVMADCIDPSGVAMGDSYLFSITNSTAISNASISFWEYNNDCQGGCSSAQAFSVQYDTDPAFGNLTTVQSFVPSTPGSASYTFPISGTLPANTYYFRILATGMNHDGTAEYVLDNVTITGSH